MVSKIFISYRREDSGHAAGRIYDFLATKIGKERLFIDVFDIKLAKNFIKVIQNAIDDSAVILLIIGNSFVSRRKLLFNKNDYVRLEISYALSKGKIVIPVIIDDVKMPKLEDIPANMQGFLSTNGAYLRQSSWIEDCNFFWEDLNLILNEMTLYKKVELLSDIRDNKKYSIIKINGKTWMSENLDYNIGEGSWVYEKTISNGIFNFDRKKLEGYGRLYTWNAAMKACPPGWRLPTDQEWSDLANFFGGYHDKISNKVIQNPNKGFEALVSGGLSGFNAKLGGFYRHEYEDFISLGYGYFWTLSETNSFGAIRFTFDGENRVLYKFKSHKASGLSVRCIKE